MERYKIGRPNSFTMEGVFVWRQNSFTIGRVFVLGQNIFTTEGVIFIWRAKQLYDGKSIQYLVEGRTAQDGRCIVFIWGQNSSG